MTSIGNDLVFLPSTRPERTNLPRFYSRILTDTEVEDYQRLASSTLPFDHYVWLCWSIKESVFKYQKRLSPELRFAPLRITVRRIDPPNKEQDFYAGVAAGFAGSGDGAGQILYSRTLIRDGVIASVVSADQTFTDVHWGFSPIDSPAHADQSAAVRTLALKELRAVLSRDDLQLQKDAAGCPVLFGGDEPLAIPVSLAHHERYIAYSFLSKVV